MRPALLALTLACTVLAGCESLQRTDSFMGFITPYRIDIVQGNVVTQEQLELLKPGMSRNQVRDVLGSPLLTDAFHADRWDYLFTIRRPGTEAQRRSIVVVFEGDAMKSVQAPPLPTEREFVASITRDSDERARVPKLELTEAERRALPAPARRDTLPGAAGDAAPAGPAREYPPLEPSR